MIKEIKKLISEGKTKEALESSIEYFEMTEIKQIDDIYLLLNQFNSISRDKALGLIDKENETNRIVKALIGFLGENVDKEIKVKKYKVPRNTFAKHKIFISSLILIIVALGFLFAKNNYSNLSLYNYYSSSLDPSVIVSRGYIRETNPIHEYACTSFIEGRFNDSKKAYEGICDSISTNKITFADLNEKNSILANAKYATALNLLYLGEFESANETFKEYLKVWNKIGNNQSQSDLSEWAMIMCKLKINEINYTFKVELKNITLNKIHTFNKQANDLEKKLKSKWRILINEKRL